MSKYKCKGCQWYNKPYWSIINPCDNCPREEANIQILTRWQDPIIEELKSQLQQKENIIREVREYMKTLSDEYAKDDYDIKCDVFNKLYYEILDKENK